MKALGEPSERLTFLTRSDGEERFARHASSSRPASDLHV